MLKEKQAKRKEIRAEQEKKLNQAKKEEEEKLKKDEAERKAKEEEDRKKAQEEADAKRREILDAQKLANDQGKKSVSGTSSGPKGAITKEQLQDEMKASLAIRIT